MAENSYLKGYAEQDQFRRGLNLSAFQYGAALHSQGSIPTPKPPRKAKNIRNNNNIFYYPLLYYGFIR